MMCRHRRGFVIAGIILSLLPLGIQAVAHDSGTQDVWCRTEGGTNYEVPLDYLHVHTTESTCPGVEYFCITTNDSGLKLQHTYFTQNFTAQQRLDADRFIQWMYGAWIDANWLNPTSGFNCHTYAFYPWYGREDIWIEDQATALSDDFEEVDGTCVDPYQVGHICAHLTVHSSKIIEIDQAVGYPDDAAEAIRSKWGIYGKYDSGDDLSPFYPDVSGVYKED